MKIEVEISNPHYHPGKDWNTPLTKKRDLTVPPHWVANERMEDGQGNSYGIVMPPREKELLELRQPVHIHMPEYLVIKIGEQEFKARIKVEKGYDFEPKVHFDNVEAEEKGINSGDIAEL